MPKSEVHPNTEGLKSTKYWSGSRYRGRILSHPDDKSPVQCLSHSVAEILPSMSATRNVCLTFPPARRTGSHPAQVFSPLLDTQ